MLNKLLKYDLKSMAKSLIPFYGLTLMLGLLVRIMGIIREHFPLISFIHGMMIVCFIVLLVATIFYTFFISVKRFYNNVLKDEGYLTNTLPVKRSKIVLSKILASLLSFIFSIIIMFIALLIAWYSKGAVKIGFTLINLFFISMEVTPWIGYVYTIVVLFLAGYMNYIIIFYLSLILGHQKNTNKLAYSIVYGLIIYGVFQVLSSIALRISVLFDPTIINIMNSEFATFKDMAPILITSGILAVMSPFVCYFLSCKFINTKLNLE